MSFATALRGHGDAPALISPDGALSYRDLADRVDDVADRLGPDRRLVLVECANQKDAVIGYLAALAGGHVAILAAAERAAASASLLSVYDPDVVIRSGGLLDERRGGTAHDLHPDLALLLSTSGSTGSPKLVRLSHENLQSNAESIAQYLDIRPDDRAATTLPMHYCYGLSVINSHLLAGASLLLTDLSVVDSCFWNQFRQHRATSFAGVPYTFDLLDRVGFDQMDLPHLRYVTQAGGRLAPDRVRRYAELGRARGWDLFVMYGQTEATARMAYLPPQLAASHPGSIGIPVPGGSLHIEPSPDHEPGTGELVYAGPNVMLGYAETREDLALGRSIDMLRTGDLARRTDDGLLEIVGRRSRFVKIFGLRIDLQRAESVLAVHGLTASCVGDDDELVVVVQRPHDKAGAPGSGPDAVRRLLADELGLPAGSVRVLAVDALPRLASGKPDLRAVTRLAEERSTPAPVPHAGANTTLRALFAELLERPDAKDDDTFVSLGGDSLSYVEMSVRLEDMLGHLPPNWHVTPIGELAAPSATAQQQQHERTRRPLMRAVETSVLLRALAIILIVGTHAKLFTLLGSAHVLVAVAGYNFARFQLRQPSRVRRLRAQLASVARIAVPSAAWIAIAAVLTGAYGLTNVLLLNAIVGPETWTSAWHFWFIEVLVYILLVLAGLLAVPAVDRLERRAPFAFAGLLVGVGLLGRFEVVDLGVPHTRPVFWLFALGWATALASTRWQRIAVTAIAAATVPGFFGDPWRDALILGGFLLLVWAPTLRCPAPLTGVASLLASSSLYIYLTHWQVYPLLQDFSPLLAVLASVVLGVAYWAIVSRAQRWMRAPERRLRSPARTAVPSDRRLHDGHWT
ncbi:MAG TPA: AMP-binding protein [Actinomycetales bacterium]|nr:AMP-binding protein [Actinomycetales bacterium]